eukprot:scaffold2788_cov376-Prasinococcus_capsulatus_cf.AAC.7
MLQVEGHWRLYKGYLFAVAYVVARRAAGRAARVDHNGSKVGRMAMAIVLLQVIQYGWKDLELILAVCTAHATWLQSKSSIALAASTDAGIHRPWLYPRPKDGVCSTLAVSDTLFWCTKLDPNTARQASA